MALKDWRSDKKINVYLTYLNVEFGYMDRERVQCYLVSAGFLFTDQINLFKDYFRHVP